MMQAIPRVRFLTQLILVCDKLTFLFWQVWHKEVIHLGRSLFLTSKKEWREEDRRRDERKEVKRGRGKEGRKAEETEEGDGFFHM